MLRTNDKEYVIAVRVNKEERDSVIRYSKMLGFTSSEFIRQAIRVAINNSNVSLEQIKPVLNTLFDNLIDNLKGMELCQTESK